MRVLLDVQGMSQYSEYVRKDYQASACGPTTAHVILKHVCAEHQFAQKDINELYKFLGGTKIGLFKWRMISKLRKALGEGFNVAACTISEAIEQLRAGNPVAMKFDKYTTLQWFTKKKPLYSYHWVPLIGYEIKDDCLHLIIHDNGGKNRPSKVRTFCYEDNRHVLSFVKIDPKNKKVNYNSQNERSDAAPQKLE